MLPLICLDIDGTLIGAAGTPSDAVMAAAQRATRRGQRLALCTARVACGEAFDLAQRIDPEGWHIFHTGAVVYNLTTAESIRLALSESTVHQLHEIGSRMQWVVETYTDREVAVDSDAPYAVQHSALLGIPHVRRSHAELREPVVRVQWIIPAKDLDAAISAVPQQCAGSAATSPMMPGATFFSVVDARASKSYGIRTLAERLAIDIRDVMMVGDGLNDCDAVSAVGHGVAMGNAEPELLDVARYRVGTVEDDGAAEALELSATLATADGGSNDRPRDV